MDLDPAAVIMRVRIEIMLQSSAFAFFWEVKAMSNLLERSILMTIGAASLSRDVAEALAGELVGRGRETTDEGRESVNELVQKARDETRTAKSRIDASLQRTFRDIGVATEDQLEEMQLKIAQLEHRLSLLEADTTARKAEQK